MEADPHPIRRYELKYTVSESQAEAIRDYIQPLFSLDKHACPERRGYTVSNVYLDTPRLRFYNDTKFKQEVRLKPRVRYYGREPDDVVILEVKHRHNTVTWKRRRQIEAHQWPGVLEVSASQQTSPSHIGVPETFEEVNHLYGTSPVLLVRYFREPYVSDIDEYGRITFDRGLRYRAVRGTYELASRDDDMAFYGDQGLARQEESPVVLEIKTLTAVPLWVVELVRRFSLVQRGYSKYCYAVDRCLENGHDALDLAL